MAVPTVLATATTNTAAATSHAVDLPTHSEGDLLLMVLEVGADRTATVSDWTEVFVRSASAGAFRVYCFAKIAGASEGATKTAALSGSAAVLAAVSAISGAANIGTTPIVAGSAGGLSGSSHNAPSIVATDSDSLIIAGAADAGGTSYSGALSGYTNIANLGNATSFDDMTVFSRDTGAAAGTVNAVTVSADTSQSWVAFQLAVAPTSGGGGSAIPAFVHHRKLLGVQ